MIPAPNLPTLGVSADGSVSPSALAAYVHAIERWEQTVKETLTPHLYTTGFLPVGGWSYVYTAGWRMGPLITLRVIVTRTGGTITIPASGIIGLTSIALAPKVLRGTSSMVGTLSSGGVGRTASGVYLSHNGSLQLAAVGGSTNIVNGDDIELGGAVIVEGLE